MFYLNVCVMFFSVFLSCLDRGVVTSSMTFQLPLLAERRHDETSRLEWYDCGENLCKCIGDMAMCSRRGQPTIPPLPSNVSKLLFVGSLTENLFANVPHIRTLTLESNNLTYIPRGILKPMLNLTKVVLSSNPDVKLDSIRYLLSLPGLKELNVENCNLTRFPQNAFTGLDSYVLRLSFSSNPFDEANITELLALTRLERLDMNSSDMRSLRIDAPTTLKQLFLNDNWFEEFPVTCKANVSRDSLFPDLEVLDLGFNIFQSTVNSRRICLPVLKRLSLNGNRWKHFDNLLVIVAQLPSVRELFADLCLFDYFLIQSYAYTLKSNVRKVSLKESSFYEVNLAIFCPLERLEYLDLSLNRISMIPLDTPLRLEQLLLSKNNLQFFPKTCINETSLFPYLWHLALDGNRISSVLGDVCLPKLEYLDLSYNMLGFVFKFGDTRFPVLRILDLSNQVYDFSLRSHVFNNSQLVELSLAKNNLKFADLHFTMKAFTNCPRLSVLHLGGNNFQDVTDEQFVEMFGQLPLTFLALQQAQIKDIYVKSYATLSSLVELNLRSNKITHIPVGAFDVQPALRVLDISQNKITAISDNTFGENARTRLEKLSLGNNSFVCSCELLWFRNWLAANPSLFYPSDRHPQRYNCSNLPGIQIENFVMETQACLLNQQESIQIITILSFIILAGTFLSFLFRFRWHIRLIMYEGFRDRNNLRRARYLAGNFDFDVFVSYASEDVFWVREHLMPELEDRLGLRLCVHERDFIPGKNIVNNIADCVESSKTILMVFSKHFVQSQWCQFELTYCLSHSMDNGDELIVVCVDDVASRDMTTAMMAVLKTTTCVQWVELADAIDSFWGRVYMALRDIVE